MRRLVDRAIEAFNGWLASERGFVQAIIVSLGWNVAVAFGLDKHGFLYLFVATELGIITQFTLAIIGRRSGDKVDRALATIDQVVDDVYVASQATLRLAENELHLQEALAAQSEAIVAAVTELRTHLTKET
jgi:hypothetical protein